MLFNRSIFLLTSSVAIVGSNSLVLSPISGAVATSFSGTDAAGVMMASAFYGLGTAASALLLAPKADQFGAGLTLRIAIWVLSIALAISALAPTVLIFCGAQGLAGIAAGTALPASYGLSAQVAPKGRESEVLGIVLTGWTISMIVGVSFSALMAECVHWRSVFGTLAILGLLIAMVLGRRLAHTHPIHAHKATSPLTAWKVKGIWGALMVCAAYMIAFYGFYTFLGAHLQEQLGKSTALAGVASLAYGIGFGAAVPLDKSIDRMGAKQVSLYVFIALCLVYLLLALFSFSYMAIISFCLLWGLINHLGLNLVVGRLTVLDFSQRGAILGLYSAVTYICVFISTISFKPIFEQQGIFMCGIICSLCILPAIGDAWKLKREKQMEGEMGENIQKLSTK